MLGNGAYPIEIILSIIIIVLGRNLMFYFFCTCVVFGTQTFRRLAMLHSKMIQFNQVSAASDTYCTVNRNWKNNYFVAAIVKVSSAASSISYLDARV